MGRPPGRDRTRGRDCRKTRLWFAPPAGFQNDFDWAVLTRLLCVRRRGSLNLR